MLNIINNSNFQQQQQCLCICASIPTFKYYLGIVLWPSLNSGQMMFFKNQDFNTSNYYCRFYIHFHVEWLNRLHVPSLRYEACLVSMYLGIFEFNSNKEILTCLNHEHVRVCVYGVGNYLIGLQNLDI